MFLSRGVLEHHKVRYWWSLALIMQAAALGGWSLKKNKFCPRSFYVTFRRRGLQGLEKVCVRVSDHLGEQEPGPGYYSVLVGRSTFRLAQVVRDLSGCQMVLPSDQWPTGSVEFEFSVSPNCVFQLQGESGNPERCSVCRGSVRGPWPSRFPWLGELTAWGGGLPARAHLQLLA